MLHKIIKDTMPKRLILLGAILCFYLLLYSCASIMIREPNSENLKTRINQFYNYFMNNNYSRAWYVLAEEERGSKKDYIEYANNSNMKIIYYKIDSLSLRGLNAKVIMTQTVCLNDQESTVKSVDCWVFDDNNWYLQTAGRVADWECEVEE